MCQLNVFVYLKVTRPNRKTLTIKPLSIDEYEKTITKDN